MGKSVRMGERDRPRSRRSACERLADGVRRIAEDASSGRTLVREVGHEFAGIRPGPLGVLDLARGGTNKLRGKGFAAAYDDRTIGQVRHFAGVAAATSVFGPRLTHWLMRHVGRDAAGTADDLLTARATEWASLLIEGRLATADAAEWVRIHVCQDPDGI